MIVIAILGMLTTAVMVFLNPVDQIRRAQDSRRKGDLAQIKNALESYYNDFGQYPASDAASTPKYKIKSDANTTLDWGSTGWQYIATLPKDPTASRNYVYYSPSGGQSYYLYASLERSDDAQACNGGLECTNVPSDASCGSGVVCNYGISSSNVSP